MYLTQYFDGTTDDDTRWVHQLSGVVTNIRGHRFKKGQRSVSAPGFCPGQLASLFLSPGFRQCIKAARKQKGAGKGRSPATRGPDHGLAVHGGWGDRHPRLPDG